MLDSPALRTPIAISLGAIIGALCRYFVGQWLTQSLALEFPIGTMLINISGCFLMGFITTLASHRLSLNPDELLLITTGFLGAYTTFSSYELDAANLLETRNLLGELTYWIGSPLLGFFCFGLGVTLGKVLKSWSISED
ncbi:camphor resistance protein CrcB [[Leptolyngbya] sp. PCC 7376]|uniref:fluoride efflux transporter CrcB n=1 Tax=[Leptolyngbya] sp. PCC 7376 TaxID=111781 RepID=UPI00029ED037|nr:fluoride efflux transporter CrcB [[Leptolyngbya] sp. PCC 7376]AFY36867.1 camphor resistance protein CrcB [[Leptolyngbya] sp. PCC 7376]